MRGDAVKALFRDIQKTLSNPRLSWNLFRQIPHTLRGNEFTQKADFSRTESRCTCHDSEGASGEFPNPFEAFFYSHTEGRGIWKWGHYFDIYHRHFSKFIGREVHVLEVGVYSGGSLEMWKHYFGKGCHVYGVDIEEACKVYENDWTKILIGDQADRELWKRIKADNPRIDILIDDGGHRPEQQIVTLEEMLPHLQPGGVYLCEDVEGDLHQFSAYVQGIAACLNHLGDNPTEDSDASPFQNAVHSIHLYPFVVVIEKTEAPVTQFVDEKRGTEWRPFRFYDE